MISQKTRATLTITIGTIIIVLGTALLVAFASGYSIDFLHGRVITTGLVLLNSDPSGSTISVSGKTLGQKTPYRLEGLETGNIDVRYNHSDYRPWQSNYFVQAGEVTFADYALLIPNEVRPQSVGNATFFSQIVNSYEHNRIALTANSPVSIWDLNSNEQINHIFTAPSISGHIPTAITQASFSTDANQILTTITYDDGSIVTGLVGFPSGQFINLKDMSQVPLNNLQFNPQNSHELFSLNDGVLRKLNTDSKAVTTLGLNNITSYRAEGDRLYTLESNTAPSTTQLLVSYDLTGNGRYVLAEFPKFAQPGSLLVSHLRGTAFIATTDPSTHQSYMTRREGDRTLTSPVGSGVLTQSFSPNGRFYSYVQDSLLKTIDLEFADRYQTQIEPAGTSDIQWLTNYQLVFKGATALHIIDFNGSNNYLLPPDVASTEPALSYSTSLPNRRINYLQAGKLFYYNLQPPGGLINFR